MVHELYVHTSSCTLGGMKNLTISLPEPVLEALRVRAKAEHKSLNAWARELLSREVQQDSNWARELKEILDRVAGTAPEWKWDREETYAERLR